MRVWDRTDTHPTNAKGRSSASLLRHGGTESRHCPRTSRHQDSRVAQGQIRAPNFCYRFCRFPRAIERRHYGRWVCGDGRIESSGVRPAAEFPLRRASPPPCLASGAKSAARAIWPSDRGGDFLIATELFYLTTAGAVRVSPFQRLANPSFGPTNYLTQPPPKSDET